MSDNEVKDEIKKLEKEIDEMKGIRNKLLETAYEAWQGKRAYEFLEGLSEETQKFIKSQESHLYEEKLRQNNKENKDD